MGHCDDVAMCLAQRRSIELIKPCCQCVSSRCSCIHLACYIIFYATLLLCVCTAVLFRTRHAIGPHTGLVVRNREASCQVHIWLPVPCCMVPAQQWHYQQRTQPVVVWWWWCLSRTTTSTKPAHRPLWCDMHAQSLTRLYHCNQLLKRVSNACVCMHLQNDSRIPPSQRSHLVAVR